MCRLRLILEHRHRLELVERLCDLEIADFLVVDGDPFEERLVEESLLACFTGDIRSLDSVGHRQSRQHVLAYDVLVGAELVDQLLSGDPFSPDSSLLLNEQILGDRIGVVRLQQLLLLILQLHEFSFCLGQSRCVVLTTLFEIRQHRRLYSLADLRLKLNTSVELLDARLDGFQPLMRQVALAMLAVDAGVVLVDPTISPIAAVDQ